MATTRIDSGVALQRHAGDEVRALEGRPFLRHPIAVALLGCLVAAVAFASYPSGAGAVVAAFTAGVLVVVAATDLERRIIPNRIVLPATAVVLLAHAVASPGLAPEYVLAAIGAGIFFLIPNLINPSLMGMGDVKLAVLLGAALGRGVLPALMIACLAVLPVAIGSLIRGGASARKATLPFGPFLALGGLAVLIVPHLTSLG